MLPLKNFLEENKFKSAKGASEGSKYIDLSMKLRALLAMQSEIKDLAELDVFSTGRISQSYRY